ncbi:unnamed protein product [Nippostrongylus brasiliensis]|uniref:CBFD_NFYB_HMF domain-containing protein n=1 Tax=Nippostrongylus brasiliensis TaxID=27835 RepID=A0A0N4Y7B7_NIPBR|nr:unnamed protein product [Nippostrongylus brasiliensis]
MVNSGANIKNVCLESEASPAVLPPRQAMLSDDLSKAVQSASKASGVPACVKKVIALLAKEFLAIIQEKDRI